MNSFVCVAYMYHLRGMFGAGPYMAIICWHIYAHVRSICPCSIMSVWIIFLMWQTYLFSDIMCTVTWEWRLDTHACSHRGIPAYVYSYMHTYIHTFMYVYIHIDMHTTYMYPCTYVSMSVYIHTHMQTHMHTL